MLVKGEIIMTTENKPNGPVAAALLGAGIGSAALGIFTLASELSEAFSAAMKFYPPSGGLSGKSTMAIIIFALAWLVLHFIWKGKEVNFKQIALISLILLGVGLVFTFPPVWTLLGA